MKDIIDSSVDVSVAIYTNDIEIAEDLLKSSAWLVALATAAMYFCFQEIDKALLIIESSWQNTLLIGYVFSGVVLALSFCAAYWFRRVNSRFSAYSRNALCAFKMLRSAMIENPQKIENFRNSPDGDGPLWFHVKTGRVYAALDECMQETITDIDGKVTDWRGRVELVAGFQRGTTLFGFLLLISLKLVASVIYAAI